MGQPAPLPVGRGVEERRQRLEQIRRDVAAGRYQVDPAEVADAILRHLRREKPTS